MPTSILIADDFDDNRELLRLMLENAGYAVREARDGREFIEAALAEVPDVALIDLSMPVLDGWHALSELRADERTRSLPCVAVTAFAAEIDRQRALAAGFDAYVTKPFRSTDLVEVVERLLKEAARDGGASTPLGGGLHSRAKEIGGNGDGGHG
ncbi:MAG TPA: response regulator [Pyrinomonadaceae bacterium]|jgi:two-component system cell cycle response regulator DivK